jgi:F0F1-type ATP synthase assembly protein I
VTVRCRTNRGTEDHAERSEEDMSADHKSDDPRREDEMFPGLRGTSREIGPYLTLGIQLAAAVVFFFLVGWWLDTKFGTNPVLKIVGLTLGFVGGMIKFLRSAFEMGKKDKSL